MSEANPKISGITRRQEQIIAFVRERGFATLDVMAEKFGVSQQTVRRDVIQLNKQNLLQRHYGGAGLPAGIDGKAYSNRKIQHAHEKALIGKAVAADIPDGSSLFIDIGTTTEAVVKALLDHKDLKIITNHIRVVSTLCENTDFEIILSGGLVRNRDWAVTGESSVEFIREFRVEYGIFGAGSITDDGQLLDYDYRDAQTSRAARDISKCKIVVMDHSKFNADAMMPFAKISELDKFYTSRVPPDSIREVIERSGTELIVA
jgi:DeoR family glycerol-3-phosphate regulon repressor